MNKQVLITGSSRGIGKGIALYLAENGYDIVLHYNKNKTAADDVLQEIIAKGVSARALQFDIKNTEDCKSVLLADIEKHGVYYGVVCNAGVVADNSFPIMEKEEWDSVLRTNLDGFFNVLQPLIMPMVQTRKAARIITMSSVSGIIGNRGQVNYSASKAGIIGATKSLAIELAKHKITVNCVAPGVIETDMTADLPMDIVKKSIPMRRIGKTKEIASLVNYLLSEDAGYITRQVFSVNGGLF